MRFSRTEADALTAVAEHVAAGVPLVAAIGRAYAGAPLTPNFVERYSAGTRIVDDEGRIRLTAKGHRMVALAEAAMDRRLP